MSGRENVKSIELKRRVRWADADAAGRIYYPRIFDYAGEGEHALLQSVGISREDLRKNYDFPRVHAECHFKKMLRLGAHFTIRVWPGKLGRTSIQYNFEIVLDEETQDVAAKGSVTVVAMSNGKPAEIPAEIRSRLEP
jgi:acyl-CoA thioester hydrolase